LWDDRRVYRPNPGLVPFRNLLLIVRVLPYRENREVIENQLIYRFARPQGYHGQFRLQYGIGDAVAWHKPASRLPSTLLEGFTGITTSLLLLYPQLEKLALLPPPLGLCRPFADHVLVLARLNHLTRDLSTEHRVP